MNEDQIKDIICNCYLKILKREPDIEGLKYYLNLMEKNEIDEVKLEEILRGSDEFVGYKQIDKSSFKKLENKSQINTPKIIAMYRIQNEERWIEKSLEETSKVCQEIVILDDCSTDNTVNICKKFPKVVDIYERKEPLPLDEVRDKNLLLQMALKRNPEYVLALDGDEILAPHSKEILFEELRILYSEALVFSFQFLYVWDDPTKIRYDGIYGKTWSPRLLKINNNTSSLTLQETDYPGNLHCGSIPKLDVDDYLFRSNVKILHYGYHDNEIRQKKILYYNKIDPNSSEQGNYVHIVSGEGNHSGPKGMEFIFLPDFLLP